MKAVNVKRHVGKTPYMKLKKANFFYDLIEVHQLTSILELGFFHGVSTAYLAGALEEIGGGKITTIDLVSAKDRKPSVEELLSSCGLLDLAEIFYEPSTFNWRLMKFLEEPVRSFDLCYIDGGHTWVDTGFAFCLVRQLIRPGGWIVFDDVPHTYRSSSSRDKPWVLRMTEEEQITPQVEKVFSLLAMRDKDFNTFRRISNLGVVRKRTQNEPTGDSVLRVEAQICTAAQKAHRDPEFRQYLLQEPARALSRISGESESLFRHIRFLESDRWCPLDPEFDENGIIIHFLEKPDWEKSFSETSLVTLLQE